MNATEISGSRGKMALYLGGSLAFVAVAALLLQHPTQDAGELQLGLGFFGLCAAVFAWRLISPQRLRLDDEGFTVLVGFAKSPRKIYWRDIDRFFIYRLPRGVEMIGFNYRPDARDVSPMVRISRQLGADGWLPKGWTLSPAQMVDMLNAYRLKAEAGETTGGRR